MEARYRNKHQISEVTCFETKFPLQSSQADASSCSNVALQEEKKRHSVTTEHEEAIRNLSRAPFFLACTYRALPGTEYDVSSLMLMLPSRIIASAMSQRSFIWARDATRNGGMGRSPEGAGVT